MNIILFFSLLRALLLVRVSAGLGRSGHQEGVFHVVAHDEDSTHEGKYSKPVPEMIRSYGYVCEVHNYTTLDGYINTLHRIPPSPNVPRQPRAVFLQHGLMGTSADYVMGAPNVSLAYMLADRGYDVWLGNARGNKYSRLHETLTTEDPEYWRFSFDEMGKYDLPAALEYVQKHSNDPDKKLLYIGHSMGTVMFWVAMHEHQAWMSERIETMVAMGPVARVDNIESPIRILAPFAKEINLLFQLLGVHEFKPSNWIIELFDRIACDATMRELKVCENVLFLLTGFDAKEMNMTMLPIILGHEPGGGSTQTVIHFAQEVDAKHFQKFDYGAKENQERYGQASPPLYDLSRVTVPVILMWAQNDWLADPTDVKTSLFDLPNLVENYCVPEEEFNHVDFIWGLSAPKLVYSKIFKHFGQLDE